jgi:putative transcriptional regulator
MQYDFTILIKEVCVQLALSQEDWARVIGVSYATVNRWENGRFMPFKMA